MKDRWFIIQHFITAVFFLAIILMSSIASDQVTILSTHCTQYLYAKYKCAWNYVQYAIYYFTQGEVIRVISLGIDESEIG